jgi:hypothetical protein
MGSLENAGVFLGEVARQTPRNIKGNQENIDIVGLNDQVLRDNRSAWDRPPAKLVWGSTLRDQRDRIIAHYADHEIWGFKDPRTVLTLPFWLEALPQMTLVGTFRNPTAVAGSLAKRHNWPHEKGVNLWLAYNRIIRDLVEQRAMPLISFDLPQDQYLAKLQFLFAKLGLSRPEAAAGFFDEGLRHQPTVEPPVTALPPEVQELYAFLQQRAV